MKEQGKAKIPLILAFGDLHLESCYRELMTGHWAQLLKCMPETGDFRNSFLVRPGFQECLLLLRSPCFRMSLKSNIKPGDFSRQTQIWLVSFHNIQSDIEELCLWSWHPNHHMSTIRLWTYWVPQPVYFLLQNFNHNP